MYPYRFKATNWPRSIVLWWRVPLLWKLFPWSRCPTMYVNDPDDPFEVEHEFGHVIWLWEIGCYRFYWRYLTLKTFKRDAECYANARRIKLMVDGGGFDADILFAYWGTMTARAYGVGTPARCEERIRYYYEEIRHA